MGGHVPRVQNPPGDVRTVWPPCVHPVPAIISTPVFAFAMSQSPSASISNISEANSKKRKAPHPNSPGMAAEGPASPQQSSAHIPKRGARACTSCRKGKNRCEGEVGDFCSRRYPRSVPLIEARLPRSRPGTLYHRLPVVVAKLVAFPASSKTREEKCTGPVRS